MPKKATRGDQYIAWIESSLSYARFLAGQHEIQRTQRVRDYACGKICHKLVLHNILTWHDILTFSDDTVNKIGGRCS
jgi:hypothetical protein